ncbi:large conductance mechanosensitive channel protein, partial [Geranomyces variabilis]
LKSAKATASILNDFRRFVLRGNVVDLALGVIIGGAFTAIVTSVVNDLLGPLFGAALGSQLQNAFVLLKSPDAAACNVTDCTALKTPSQVYAAGGVTWNYGAFFQTIINFIFTAACVFLFVKLYSAATHKPVVEKKEKERRCPYCLKLVPLLAQKCFLCTS